MPVQYRYRQSLQKGHLRTTRALTDLREVGIPIIKLQHILSFMCTFGLRRCAHQIFGLQLGLQEERHRIKARAEQGGAVLLVR